MTEHTTKYPEHEKLSRTAKLSDFTQELGAWLDDNNYEVCELVCRSCGRSPEDGSHYRHGEDTEWVRVPTPGIQGLLVTMFGVDLAALEAEKRDMLDKLAKAQAHR